MKSILISQLSLYLSVRMIVGIVELTSATPYSDDDPVKLENPMDVAYLKKKLRKGSPRLVLTPAIEKQLKKDLKSDEVVKNVYEAIKLNAEEIQQQPLLEREMEGRRLLGVSREMLYRMNILGMTYRIDRDDKVLNRVNDEVTAVCNFSDWNPSHYLDVAEMSLAVALAVDWVGEDLPASTVKLAKNALIEKGIMPSYNEKGNVGWIDNNNNWNQVCHGGMIAASVVIAEQDPELAAKTIHRALEGMPHALEEYGPDGVYPEGSTYWRYGTSFSVLTASMLESAFGTDFGLADYPAFKESAEFRALSMAPSGWYYNFADCGDKRSENGDMTLAWFAIKTGNEVFYEKERFLRDPAEMGELSRWTGAGLVWLSQFEEDSGKSLPLAWKGNGSNPVVFFRTEEGNPNKYYFGGKGGRGSVNHGNMDAGSFIFELNGVRWVIDPGNQKYHNLEKTGFNLWGRCQECERWTLLTKNNYGHSTVTVNNALHHVDGFAAITDFQDGEQPEVTIDMSEVFGNHIASATRRFVKEDNQSLLIEDQIVPNDSTQHITWQLMTTADVDIVEGGATLRQDGKELTLENLSHPDLTVSIISLDPAPLELDRQIDGLKRLEIRIPAYLMSEDGETIRVRLSAE
ncbi:heparinase II/III domain-containing protein [Tunicatimonas pelagia]|uniref:heparinase II/III domain-containing protein n=1 Tax=Tunicatimonas pelagia TaxID=931531 RepID=UPI00266537FA|nr:heparinase II/III family protein [Tunicatimonas pelagia]WKN42406.1 heparinase II/III family protein [Tunicatimonas pelagia]